MLQQRPLAPAAAPACVAAQRGAPAAPARAPCASARRRRSAAAVRASVEPPAPWNPQNVGSPLVVPAPSLSPSDAVRVQLEAVSRNDVPRTDHGIATLYEFCADAGSMERSRYFGFSKDLYHMDHFMGGLRNAYPQLFTLQRFEVVSERVAAGGAAARVEADVWAAGAAAAERWVFDLEKGEFGLKKGCWLTKRLLPADSKWL